jgi:hypothetical protein
MTEFEKVRNEIRDRLIETVYQRAEQQRAEQLWRLDAAELMYAAVLNELTRIELRMRALAGAARVRKSDDSVSIITAIERGDELPQTVEVTRNGNAVDDTSIETLGTKK